MHFHLYSKGCRKPSIINDNVCVPPGDNLALLRCSSVHTLHLHLFKSAHPECPPWPILWDDSHSWNFLAWLLRLNKRLRPFSDILSGFIRKNVVCPSHLDSPCSCLLHLAVLGRYWPFVSGHGRFYLVPGVILVGSVSSECYLKHWRLGLGCVVC